MVSPSIGFVGGGRVAHILLQGWQRAGITPPRIVVCEPNEEVAQRLVSGVSSLPVAMGDLHEVGQQHVIFLAVHPPAITEVVTSIRKALSPTSIVVSLAPKITMAELQTLLGGQGRIVRVIPNAASLVGQGFNPVAWGKEITAADQEVVHSLLTPLGVCPEVAEPMLEAYAVITAMGPTYFWPQWLELITIAEEFGLSHREACTAVEAMIKGAADTLFNSELSPPAVLDLIPVKPLLDFEPTIRQEFHTRLTTIFNKIKPQAVPA